ncbi:MAG TPA: phosphoenolpyruvate synthase, partial [Bacteroidia bacterium]|nr:phosphoenolpyruvate synthase [Bacteroidia bacterium]
MKTNYILDFREIDKTMLALIGGKGASLGELFGIDGVQVPEGFCITTEAYRKITGNNPELDNLLAELTRLDAEDLPPISEKIRTIIENISIPEDIEDEIARYLIKLGEKNTYAVRSSATAEDLPTASFAGQHDTYLNVTGKEAILKHISKCWASLFTDRAVTYRLQNGFDHRKVHLSVVIQKMVFPRAAGIMFTADPVTGNRKILSIDASFGLGEALVSGIVNTDNYKVIEGRITNKRIPAKNLAIYALKDGGTKQWEIEPGLQNKQTLTDEQILRLEYIGRKIEKHFGNPQDIEWCLADDTFYIVQSRPITTLYPIPLANDQENHVYISVGHQQMMTDAIKPLGLSFFLLTTRAPMRTAGGRLFVDVTPMLASPASRTNLLNSMTQHDPLMKDALLNIVEREGFIKLAEGGDQVPGSGKTNTGIPPANQASGENSPAVVPELIKDIQKSLADLRQAIQIKSGTEVFDFILEDIQHLKKILFDPQSHTMIIAAMDASTWLNEKLMEWLGEKNAADKLSQSVANNITSEMGLELMGVADVIRPYPKVIEYLQHVTDDNFLDELLKLEGGQETRNAIYSYLNKYG